MKIRQKKSENENLRIEDSENEKAENEIPESEALDLFKTFQNTFLHKYL